MIVIPPFELPECDKCVCEARCPLPPPHYLGHLMRARAPMQSNVTLLGKGIVILFVGTVRICYTLMHCRRHEFPFPWPGCVVSVPQGHLPPERSDQRCLYLSAPFLVSHYYYSTFSIRYRFAQTEVWRGRRHALENGCSLQKRVRI